MTGARPRVLVVDDEPAVLRALSVALEANGYEVDAATSGEQALRKASNAPPGVVLLDLGLPGMDGLEVIRRLRAFLPTTPVVVVSAWGDDETKVAALDLGADDYVTKPFALPEVLARVRVALRHGQQLAGRDEEAAVLRRGPLEIDLLRRRVTVGGEEASLTPTQFDLLLCFARHPGRVLTHRAIVAEVWGDPDAADAQNLRVQVSQLRRRLEAVPGAPRLIQTDVGVGYRLLTAPA